MIAKKISDLWSTFGMLFFVLTSYSLSGNAAEFIPIGQLPDGVWSITTAISNDGSVVAGTARARTINSPIRWSEDDGISSIGLLPGTTGVPHGEGRGISGDGSIIVGNSSSATSSLEAFRWTTSSGMIGLGVLNGFISSAAESISADGTTIVGRSSGRSRIEATVWKDFGTIFGIGDLPGGDSRSAAFGVSNDGKIIVGESGSSAGNEAFRWSLEDGIVGLGDLSGGEVNSAAFGVSGNGMTIVGDGSTEEGREAWIWTEADGMLALGDLAGGAHWSRALDASYAANMVIGFGHSSIGMEAVVWTKKSGLQRVQDVASLQGATGMEGWVLNIAMSISDDGTAIAGSGTNPAGMDEGWVITGLEPHTMYLIEAEEMRLDTYRIEGLSFASNDALINLKGPGISGSATAPFPGADGIYDITMVYHDENDGESQLSVSIDGNNLESWTLDEQIPGGEQAIESNRMTRRIAMGYSVRNGDEIRIEGLQDDWDHANVDYIRFVLTQPQTPLRIETEDMQLNSYKIEALDFASDGALINLKGPGLNGSATTSFPSDSGQYDIFVVYHDENDGVALLNVSIAGVSIDSWILDQRILGGQQPEVFNRFVRQIASRYTIHNGDEIRIDGLQGNWDNANVDYIEFVPAP